MKMTLQHTMYMDVVFEGTPTECFEVYHLYDQYKVGNLDRNSYQAIFKLNRVPTMTAYYHGEKIEDMTKERLMEVCAILHLDKDYDLETMSKDELKELLINNCRN